MVCVGLSNGLVFKWWSVHRTEESLFMVQNVRYSNGLPSHVPLPFEYWTLILSSIQMNPFFAQMSKINFSAFFLLRPELTEVKVCDIQTADKTFDTDNGGILGKINYPAAGDP